MRRLDQRIRPDAASLAAPANGLVFIIGAPRSGTTWLAKIFDSHPRVLYRHEPDTIIRFRALPVICDTEAVHQFRDLAIEYLRELISLDTLKTSGSAPIFPKDYLTPAQSQWRKAMILAGRAVEFVRGRGVAGRLRMPEPVRLDALRDVTVVIKSVSARGRAGLFAAVAPETRFLFVVRHPCGRWHR